MASQIRVEVPRAFQASQAVGGAADGLRAELAILSREWDNLFSGWTGAAASSYAATWEDWHDGAATLVEALARSSQLLERAAEAYDEQETAAAHSVRTIPVGVDL